jgi:hypothetical protein
MLQTDTSGQPPYPAGAAVPRSAKYAAMHRGHHLPYQMMRLFGGEQFPRCTDCGDAVTYVEVIRSRHRDRPAAIRSTAALRAV